MPRKRSRDHLAVSLFPFLSILACVIGVLTLMITALTLGQVGEKAVNQEAIDRAEEYLRIKADADKADAKSQQVIAMLTQGKLTVDALEKAKADLAALKARREAAAKSAASEAQTTEALAKLTRRGEELEKQLKKLHDDAGPLTAEVESREKSREPVVTIRPGGTGVNLKPTFVECAAAGLVLYEGQPPTALAVPRAAMAGSDAFLKLLDRVAQQEGSTVVFLIRPNGIGTYHAASAMARARYAHHGKLPVPGEGRLDLSLFRQAP